MKGWRRQRGGVANKLNLKELGRGQTGCRHSHGVYLGHRCLAGVSGKPEPGLWRIVFLHLLATLTGKDLIERQVVIEGVPALSGVQCQELLLLSTFPGTSVAKGKTHMGGIIVKALDSL